MSDTLIGDKECDRIWSTALDLEKAQTTTEWARAIVRAAVRHGMRMAAEIAMSEAHTEMDHYDLAGTDERDPRCIGCGRIRDAILARANAGEKEGA